MIGNNSTSRILRTMGLASVLALVPVGAAAGGDWPQYRGPNHDGIAVDEKVPTAWPASGPRVLWKIPVGEAFGSFAVAGGRACYFAERDGGEVAVALDADSGRELWATRIDRTIFERQGGNGPRTTPAIDGERIYILGTYLKLACLNAADGKVIWSRDLASEFDGQLRVPGIQKWGNAASPVVDGGLVYVGGGGSGQSIIAFNKLTGEVAWKAHDEKITHATPVPATIHGVRQVIFFMQSGLVSVAADDGRLVWRHPFRFDVSTASSPIVAGDIVYCSAGYGVGGGACRVTREGDGFRATEIWRTPGETMNHWTTPSLRDGHLYGIFSFKEYGTAPLKCIDIRTGRELWSEPGFGQGGSILVDGHVLIQGDQGQLVLAEATPDRYREVARTHLLSGKCWTMPVVSNGRIYARSTKEAICLEVGTGEEK